MVNPRTGELGEVSEIMWASPSTCSEGAGSQSLLKAVPEVTDTCLLLYSCAALTNYHNLMP